MKAIEIDDIDAFEGVLLDVRLADDFEAEHLPGAQNNCVFEVAFTERLEESAPDVGAAICVYGAASDSGEAAKAAEKLERAGYTDVHVFTGGVEAWKAAGRTLEGSGEAPDEPEVMDGRYRLDLEASRVVWIGRNLLNKHWGTVALTSGHLDLRGGVLERAEFTMDLREIRCKDLEGDPLHDVLVAHLHNDDFFDVAVHPTATFVVDEAKPLSGRLAGAPNLAVLGKLTLRGREHPLTIEAASGVTPEGYPAAQAAVAIDRTLWGVEYGSGKLFRRLAGHLVNDLIELQIKIVGQPA